MPSIESTKPSLAPSKPFSIAIGSKAKPKAGPLTNGLKSNPSKKRPHSALADPDSDHEDIGSHVEAVSGFSSGKAVHVEAIAAKKHLIIKAEKNRDWRRDSHRKRGKNILPPDVQAAQNGAQQSAAASNDEVERAEVSQEAGLKFVPKKDQDGNVEMSGAVEAGAEVSETVPKTADEEALAALLGDEKKSTLTIPTQDTQDQNNLSEDGRFRADVASRPESASLADYAAVPIEEFGAACLRGMGWTEGSTIGKRRDLAGGANTKPREVQRRPALLGIGAKETPGGMSADVELGAWGKTAKGKGKGKKTEAYNPVMLKNSETGEMITEEELELRKAEAKSRETGAGKPEEDNWRERRDRNLKASDERRKRDDRSRDERERERERDNKHRGRDSRDNDRDRDRDRQRDRSRSSDKRNNGYNDYSSSRRQHRSRSRDRDRDRHNDHKSSRHGRERERSISPERRRRKTTDHEYDRRQRDRDRVRDRERDHDHKRR